MRHTKEALHWIVKILRKHKIPFQISGGLAAEMYGSKRKLADIDIDISENRFDLIIPEVKTFITYGPSHYKDKNWNLHLMTLNYKGQVIDICGAYHTKIFDHIKKRWVTLKTDFAHEKQEYILGLRLPTITKGDLIEYKKELSRKVDRKDVKDIT